MRTQMQTLSRNLYKVYLQTLGIRLHRLRRYLSRQADRLFLKPELESLLAITDEYTMVDRQRRKNLWHLAQVVNREQVAGDFVEFGVCNGGTAGILAYGANRSSQDRLSWLYDSFEGLPEPTERDGAEAARYSGGRQDGQLKSIGKCVGALEVVQDLLLQRLKLDTSKIRLVKGWFQDTIDDHPQHPLALMHLDGDWYDSVKLCLDKLYDRVSPGGFIVLDDYGYWRGAREALHDFLSERHLNAVQLERCGYTQVFFRKV